MKILIKNGRVIDPGNNIDGVFDLAVDNGCISALDKKISASADKVIDASGKLVIPGIVDLHVHLRQPGREDKETVASASRAAAKGGVTTVVAMPNTEPAMDCVSNIKRLKTIIAKDACINVLAAAAITKNREGKKVVDIGRLKKEGVVAISDDGSSVEDARVMEAALAAARKHDMLVICHCQDQVLSKDGMVNRGFTSTKLGLRGISKESEYTRLRRDIELARKTGARIHIAHVSCKESIEIIAEAKKQGLRVSAETAPHYFSLSEEAVWGYDTNMKMNPPLRTKEDVRAIKQGLSDGTIDAIASDHAPHTINEKAIEFDRAAFGVIGLETELAVSVSELIDANILSWSELIRKLSFNPAQIIKSQAGTLAVGRAADIAIISEQIRWTIQDKDFISKSRNSCFLGKTVRGKVDCTICRGEIVYG